MGFLGPCLVICKIGLGSRPQLCMHISKDIITIGRKTPDSMRRKQIDICYGNTGMKLQHLECLMGFGRAPAIDYMHPPPRSYSSKKEFYVSALKHSNDNDPLLLAATASASLRYQETHQPEPLFVDPYAGCLVPPNISEYGMQRRHPFCLATKFIDDKLLRLVNETGELKQVVLFTDGMDTRPYRLNWPTSTMIFDISPEMVFKIAAEKLEGVGAKFPKSCLFFHIPLESSNISRSLHSKGFNGTRPSVWAIQGLPTKTLANFEDVLSIISSLAIKGSIFTGEMPAWLTETEIGGKSNTGQWMEKLFMSNGFRVNRISYEGVAESWGKEPDTREYNNILFDAEQLRLSDDQMDTWRREFQRIEDEGDEEGFEEL